MCAHDKQGFRQRFRRCRASISLKAQREAAEEIVAKLLQHPYVMTSTHLGGYFPLSEEISLLPFFERVWSDSLVELFLPRIFSKEIKFFRYSSETVLQRGRHGFVEPLPEHPMPLGEGSLILMPLVAFDHLGSRLGMGGGYYDRFFEKNGHIKRLGIAYDCQYSEQLLPITSLDVPLTSLITPSRIYWFSSARREG